MSTPAASEVLRIADLVSCQEGSVVSRQIIKADAGNVTIFAFDAGQELSDHTSPYDALAHILDGQAEIRIAGKMSVLHAGDAILMPANVPHGLRAITRFKMLLEEEPEVLDVAQHVAYEAYLKDTSDATSSTDADEPEEVQLPGSPEPTAKIDASGDLQIEMDTKNAHVWNELGNVYFNSSAYDDAIVAYSKAIELDRWFAWPYSNLALAYVQKRRFVEAILLYQRSIELFSGDKDKAISWNRLGNVYRRLNDYENAIAAYQRADALDPDNSTLSLQSRFSLLGNYAMDQKPSYVS